MAQGRKTGGRTKGTPNKTTTAVKEALVEAFDRLGGVNSLVAWGRENPREFYMLWAKLLPREMRADVRATVAHGIAEQLRAARVRAGLICSEDECRRISRTNAHGLA